MNRVEILHGGEWVPLEGVKDVQFHPEPASEPEAGWSFSDSLALAAAGPAGQTIIRRLVEQRELTEAEATRALIQAHRGDDGPHVHLVVEEARALMNQIIGPIRDHVTELLKAMAPAFRALAEAVTAAQDATQADFRLAPPPAHRQRPRPAWQSPYGPPQRHHHR